MRRTLVLLAAILCVLAAASGVADAAPPPRTTPTPLSKYRAIIAEGRRVAEQRGLSPAQARAWRERIARVRQVAAPDGARTVVENKPLLDALRRVEQAKTAADRKKAVSQAVARLATLDDLLRDGGDGVSDANDDLRGSVLAILQTEEFKRGFRETPPPTWLEKQWKRLMEAIARFFNRLFGRGPNLGKVDGSWVAVLYNLFKWILYFVAGVLALLALFLYVRDKRLPHLRRRRAGSGTGLDIDENEVPDPLGAAHASASAGDYRGAIRLVYIASLRRLQGAGLIVLERDKTNWEYQRALRSRSKPAYDALLPATRLFDRIWYGHENATEAEYRQAVAAHDALPATADEATGADTPAAGKTTSITGSAAS